jgi:hypothetical protein
LLLLPTSTQIVHAANAARSILIGGSSEKPDTILTLMQRHQALGMAVLQHNAAERMGRKSDGAPHRQIFAGLNFK